MATAMCTTCPHTDPATALAHEATTGHTVSVWDSPTSQLPRELWPAQVPAHSCRYPVDCVVCHPELHVDCKCSERR